MDLTIPFPRSSRYAGASTSNSFGATTAYSYAHPPPHINQNYHYQLGLGQGPGLSPGPQHPRGNEQDIDVIGLPPLPEIPELILCLHFPGTEGWNNHWIAFNKKVKEFHQAMIDFNWKVLDWYWIKRRQLDRFGARSCYIAGTLITGPRMTVIITNALSEKDALSEVKRCLPDQLCRELKRLEKKGYKLCVSGKIFIFDCERVIVVDTEGDADKTYRNCLKFTLYHKNQKVNIFELYNRVYGGLKYSFIFGAIGGLLVSYLTGYFDSKPIYSRRWGPEPSLVWKAIKRVASTSVLYSIIERVLLLKFPQPQRYVISGSTGITCGTLIGLWDNCDLEQTLYAASEFGTFATLCNFFLKKQYLNEKEFIGDVCNCNHDGA